MSKKGINNNDEIEEGDEIEDEGEVTLPWTNENISDDTQDSTISEDDNLELDETEDLTESTCVSDYIQQNPTILTQNSEFEELTVDKKIVIDGAKWMTSLLCIWPGSSVSVTNGGSLCVLLQNNQEIKVVGENNKCLEAVDQEIIIG